MEELSFEQIDLLGELAVRLLLFLIFINVLLNMIDIFYL